MAKRQRGKGAGSLFKRTAKGVWIASWFGPAGKRLERSTRTTDRAAAERILAKHVADAALRREGVIDLRDDRLAEAGRRPLAAHVDEYLAHCRHAGHAARHIHQKAYHLERLAASIRDARLADLTPDALVAYLSGIKDSGQSARSVNFARQIAVAFMSWCVRTGRAEANALKVVPKQDETRDRRRVRRPLTDDELARLLTVARERGREAWYLCAALAGLRKGDLAKLTWADVDFGAGTIVLRHGKAKREDVIPMNPQLAEALDARRRECLATPKARVFPEVVTDRTRLADFRRAGLAREEVVRDARGEVVYVGTGKRRRPKVRLVTEDAEGRVIDLHAMRTTLGTRLARAGVAPQLAQRIMRHSDYRTTLKHYTVLGLTDTARAIESLPGVAGTRDDSEAAHATGTDDAGPTSAEDAVGAPSRADGTPRSSPRSWGAKASNVMRLGANASPELRLAAREENTENLSKNTKPRTIVRGRAKERAKGFEPSTFSLEG